MVVIKKCTGVIFAKKMKRKKEVLVTSSSAIALCNTIKKCESNHSWTKINNNKICKYIHWENAKSGNESFCQYFFGFGHFWSLSIIFWSVFS